MARAEGNKAGGASGDRGAQRAQRSTSMVKAADERPLSAVDMAALKWMAERVNRRVVPSYQNDPDRPGHLRSVERDRIRHHNRLCQSLGTASFAFVAEIVHKLMNPPGGSAETAVEDVNAGLEYIASFDPQNEGEATILLGAWFSHLAGTALLGRTLKTDNVEHLSIQGALAVKLGNQHIRQLEALAKLRGGGKQEVVVTHVYVGNGGQAVVGNVTSGGGGAIENSAQPPLPISAAIVSSLWGEDAREREAVLVTGGEGAS